MPIMGPFRSVLNTTTALHLLRIPTTSMDPGLSQPRLVTMEDADFPSARRPDGAASISSLSTEIITRILEELQDIDPRAVTTARLVCRAFNDLATPLAYSTVHINQAIINPSAATLFPHALRNIRTHARHIVLRSGLDRNFVSHLLNNLQKLRSVRYICLPLLSETPGLTMPDLRWSFICNTGPTYDRWVPSDIYSLTAHDPARIKIHIEGLPIGALDGKHADLYRSVIPSSLLVSLETSMQLTAPESHLPCLKELLLESRALEVFRYRGSGKGTGFYFVEGERRLPAFKELTLRSYEWTHGVEETACHWDFSRIRSLELVSVSVFNFLSSVCLADFAGLHTLRVDDSGADLNDNNNLSSSASQFRAAAASILVHHLIRDHIHSLTSLQIITQFEHFPIDALLRHSSTLKELVFRDHGAFSDDYLPSPTLRLNDLRKLARNMDSLQSLELDMDVLQRKHSTRFLVQICKFKALRRLTLNVPTVVDSEDGGESWYTRTSALDSYSTSLGRRLERDGMDPDADPDEKCANGMFEILRRQKKAESGSSSGMHVVEWERVTIKVGGWQSLMVRRVGELWRALNRRDVFAKRCFVMERVASKPGMGGGSEHGNGGGGVNESGVDGQPRSPEQHGGYGVGGGDGNYVVGEQRYVEMRLGRGHPWPG